MKYRDMKAPTPIAKLNTKQIQILKVIYKFRFVTLKLLAQYRSTDRSSLNRNLQKLVDQNFLAKQYDNSYRIDRKGARFSLTPQAVTWLKSNSDIDKKSLHAMYNNNRVEEPFVLHCLAVMEMAILLRDAYPGKFYIYSASEISGDSDFPKPRPHLYMRRIEYDNSKNNEYFVELHHLSQPYLVRKRFKQIVQHYDDEGWPDGDYPSLIFVLATVRQEKSFARFVREVLDSAGIVDLKVLTATHNVVLTNSGQTEIPGEI